MIIYGSTMSPFVRKAVAYAREKGLDFELKPVGMNDPDPGFRAASPMGKMPALDDGGFALADSSAIIHYLEARHPQPVMIPADPQQRGLTVWFDEWADTVLAACAAKMFFNRIVAPRFLGREGDEAVAAAAQRDELPRLLDYLEGIVPNPGAYLVGDAITLADLAVASPLANLSHLGITIDDHPHTAAWSRSILERPSFAQSIEREASFLSRPQPA